MDNGLRIDGQPIDEMVDDDFGKNLSQGRNFHSLASYMREKADWMRKRAEPFDKLAELLENNKDLVTYIVSYVEGKLKLETGINVDTIWQVLGEKYSGKVANELIEEMKSRVCGRKTKL